MQGNFPFEPIPRKITLLSIVALICCCLGTGILSVGCNSKKDSFKRQSIDSLLSDIAIRYDTIRFYSLVSLKHREVRRQIESTLGKSIQVQAGIEVTIGEMGNRHLLWLCDQYSNSTHIYDLKNRYNQYAQYDSLLAVRWIRLDSLFKLFESQKNKLTANQRTQELHRLRMESLNMPDAFYHATLGFHLANNFYESSQIDSARFYLQMTVDDCNNIDFQTLLGLCHFLLAKIAGIYDANYLTAEREYIKALEYYQVTDQRNGILSTRILHGFNLLQTGKTRAAVDEFIAVYSLHEQQDNTSGQALTAYYLAETYIDLKELDSAYHFAEIYYSLSLKDNSKGKTNFSDIGHAQSVLGLVEQQRGHFGSSLTYLNEASKSFSKARSQDGIALNQLRIAQLLIQDGRFVQASLICDSVLESTSDFQMLLFSRFTRAVCDFKLGSFDEAEQQLEQSILAIETSRDLTNVQELRIGLLSDKIEMYNLLTRIYLDNYKSLRDKFHLDKAYQTSLRTKARTLVENLPNKINSESDSTLDDLGDRLEANQRLLLREGHSISLVPQIHALRDSISSRHILLGNSYSTSSPNLAMFPSVDEVTAQVAKRDAVLLDYVVGEFAMGVFIFCGNSVEYEELELDVHELDSLVSDFTNRISYYPEGDVESETFISLGQLLYDKLIPGKVRNTVGGRPLYIVPSGSLIGLPFAAIIDSERKFLTEKCHIQYLPSTVTLFLEESERLNGSELPTIFAFGDPFGSIDSTSETSVSLNELTALANYFNLSSISHLGLPYARKEIEQLSDLGSGVKVQAYLGQTASESTFGKIDFARTDFLHIATHAIANKMYPMQSAILLAGDDNYDGLLQSADIQEMSIPVRSVFLSACATASGTRYPGEGVQALARSFLAAGSESVVASLWDIDDRGSAQLVEEYYNSLAAGNSPVFALSMAQRSLINSERKLYRHPHFWAPFVLMGRN